MVVALAVTMLVVAPAGATDAAAVMPVIHRWVDGFNSGDANSAAAACADETSLIDDFPPHEWHGPGACARWFADFQKMAGSDGITHAAITVGKPSHVELSVDFAYVVAPVTLSFQHKGRSVLDDGILTVTLHKGASGWRLTGWAWSDR